MEASAHRARARAALTGNWVSAVIVSLLAAILSGENGKPLIEFRFEGNNPLQITVPEDMSRLLIDTLGLAMPLVLTISVAILAVSLILGGVISLGKSRYYLKLIDGAEAEVGDLFSCFPKFLPALVMMLTETILVFLGMFLFVIPGLMLSYGFAMAPYILAEETDCTGWEALQRSYRLMRGHRLELFWLELTFIGWDILSAFTLGIGSLFVNPYKAAARASFYRELCSAQRYESAEF